jgi:endonuclease/exonuclease/phosphatase family metal-dependent hydrolase
MNAMHLAVFARSDILSQLGVPQIGSFATGVANVVGNKGAVGVGFRVSKGKSLLIINSHLSAHVGQVKQRNAEFHRISEYLPLRGFKSRGSKLATDRFDGVIWLGDLNYRVHGTQLMSEELISRGMLELLLGSDQLSIVRRQGFAFADFHEAPITFYPTYKIKPSKHQQTNGKVTYNREKSDRLPSWTDRILVKGDPDCIKIVKYNACTEMHWSDHQPVYAEINLALPAHPTLAESIADLRERSKCQLM